LTQANNINIRKSRLIVYGEIRADIEIRGQIIGAYGLLIAAHALSENLTLITNNVKEFSKIKGLNVLNRLI